MLDAQFDTLRKLALEDKERRDKENHVEHCSSVTPIIVAKRTNEYVLSKRPITVCVDMEWHQFKLLDHDWPKPWEKRIVLAARIKIHPKTEKVENVVMKYLKKQEFDDAFIDGTWYSSNPKLPYSKILAGPYMQKPRDSKSESKTKTSHSGT
jgi:hypothetical protein